MSLTIQHEDFIDESGEGSGLTLASISPQGVYHGRDIVLDDVFRCEPNYWDEPSYWLRPIYQSYPNGSDIQDEQRMTVIAKLSINDEEHGLRLIREAKIYAEKLKQLQGMSVPVFLGMYMGQSRIGHTVYCLLLEYGGEPSESLFLKDAPRECRIQVVEAYIALHDAGVQHGFDPADAQCHWLVEGYTGRPKIVDFSCAVDHSCYRTRFDIRSDNADLPKQAQYGCDELWHLLRYLYVPMPRTFNIGSDEFPASSPEVGITGLSLRGSNKCLGTAELDAINSICHYMRRCYPENGETTLAKKVQMTDESRAHWRAVNLATLSNHSMAGDTQSEVAESDEESAPGSDESAE
ncbi:hypothetical protein FA95DRAFT_1577811 [Auriscalpium vulgare]|uniref:Uncharacterized protein n=1 Tax=Auriscalpium vulgare TaxID=40419 RepID=A0ACB8R5J4_9AGAM|nr:hypothetical protein FA95DRAFT_1577811 [Auriscalpium vulgare]